MRRMMFAFAGALALAGCATGPTTRVTRFHLNQPIAHGQIAVEPILPADRGSLEFQSYASIVGAELARIGFTEAPGLAASEQVAAIGVERGSREAAARRSGFTLGFGASSYGGGRRGGSGGGVGAGVAIPIGSAKPGQIATTRLVVQIRRRSDSTIIWEGRAETEARAGSPEDAPAATVQRLATALFKDFPGASGQTITVK